MVRGGKRSPIEAARRCAALTDDKPPAFTSGPRFGLSGEFDRYIRTPITAPAANAVTAVTQLAAAWADTQRNEPFEAQEFVPLL